MQLKFETGRSMVEIIGVLAVAGVLSIGGIMGYSYGMNKYHANEAIHDVNMRMIDVATYVMRGVQIDELDSAWGESKSGYDIELFHDSDSEPSIVVKQVPTGVCKEILKSTPDTQDIFVGSENADGMDGSWYLGDNEHICDNGDKDMLFALSPEILAGFNPDGEDYIEPEGTATIPPQSECYSNADCRPDKPICDNGTCVECTKDSHCPSDEPNCNPNTKLCTACYGEPNGAPCVLAGKDYEGMCYGDANYACLNWCGETPLVGFCGAMNNYCKNQGGRATIYQLMLISDNPLYCQTQRAAGNEVVAKYGSSVVHTYTGKCPDTERYKGLWSKLRNGCSDRTGRYISNVDRVEVNRTGSLTGSECGSGNWWTSGACYDDIQAIIDAYDAANPITE